VFLGRIGEVCFAAGRGRARRVKISGTLNGLEGSVRLRRPQNTLSLFVIRRHFSKVYYEVLDFFLLVLYHRLELGNLLVESILSNYLFFF